MINRPAFPTTPENNIYAEHDERVAGSGITERDYIAIRVLQAIISKEGAANPQYASAAEAIASDVKRAYEYADAMLEFKYQKEAQ